MATLKQKMAKQQQMLDDFNLRVMIGQPVRVDISLHASVVTRVSSKAEMQSNEACVQLDDIIGWLPVNRVVVLER